MSAVDMGEGGMSEGAARGDHRPGLPIEDPEELYEDAPCGHLSTLPDGTIIKANQTLLSMLGMRGEDVVGRRRFIDLLTGGGRIYHETHYAPLLSIQGTVREIAIDLVRADGTRLPALINSVLVRTDDGDPHVIRTAVFNATGRREYERELLRARTKAERSESHARELAHTLQASLIPPAPPAIPGLDVGAAYRPAGAGDEVGGDFYDVFEARKDDWAVVVGDVCGKGAAAAAVTALARHTVRASAMRTRRPSLVLADLNAALLRDGVERFCTVLYLRVRHDYRGRVKITFASGGHPLPLRLTEGGADTAGPHTAGLDTVGTHGSLLGVLDHPQLHDTTVILHPGESLFTYTDGLVEGRRGEAFFGEERLRDALRDHRGKPAAELTQAVVDEVVDFQSGRPSDDMAAVVIGVPPDTTATS